MKRIVLYKNIKEECVLIILPAGYSGEYHSHPGLNCIFRILDGEMTEDLQSCEFSNDVRTVMKTGALATINDQIGSHQISTKTGSVSLHLYSKL